jgi:hypothetical protein
VRAKRLASDFASLTCLTGKFDDTPSLPPEAEACDSPPPHAPDKTGRDNNSNENANLSFTRFISIFYIREFLRTGIYDVRRRIHPPRVKRIISCRAFSSTRKAQKLFLRNFRGAELYEKMRP